MVLPSGDQAGELFSPLKLVSCSRLPGGQLLAVDRRPTALERHIGNMLAVRRPGGRQQRLPGLQQYDRARAVRIGQGQARVVLAAGTPGHRDIQQLRGKSARHARQLFIDRIGNTVGQHARLAGRAGFEPDNMRFWRRHHTAHNPLARVTARHAPDQQILGIDSAPVPVKHIRLALGCPAYRRAPRARTGRCAPGRRPPLRQCLPVAHHCPARQKAPRRSRGVVRSLGNLNGQLGPAPVASTQ